MPIIVMERRQRHEEETETRGGDGDMGIPGTYWPASQAESVSLRSSKRPCSIDKVGATEGDTSISFCPSHKCAHMCIPTEYTEAYTTHIHTKRRYV